MIKEVICCIATEESEGIYQLSKKCDFGKLFGLHL